MAGGKAPLGQGRAQVVVAGASGLIGTALCASFRHGGHSVRRLVRREPVAGDECRWDPADPDPGLVDGADVVVNLAGAPLAGHRWTAAYRQTIRTSRIGTAKALAEMVAAAKDPPETLLSASGIRFYGIDRGAEILTENSGPADPHGLLPAVARDWEDATKPAGDAGIAVAHLRLGLVLAKEGGLLAALLPLFRCGLGARFGAGREYWSFVSLSDAVGAIRFLAKHPGVSGPYNLTAPGPVPNREFTAALGRALHRPAVLAVPYPVLRPALGPIAGEVFGSLRVTPARLTEAGFVCRHPDVGTAIRAALTGG